MTSAASQNTRSRTDTLLGVLLGTAVGDAIGLPREALSRRRAQRMFGGPPLEQRLLLGRGMVSDDTQHTWMTAQALLASRGEPEAFARDLARRLRWWFAGLPAGVGLATAKSCLKLWCGVPPSRSGVWSAGNGPAMRSALLGVAASNIEHLVALVRASTLLTHRDPKAFEGALAVALAARCASNGVAEPSEFLSQVRAHVRGEQLLSRLDRIEPALAAGESVEAFANGLGFTRRVSGYVNETVPVAIYAWSRHPRDFRDAVEGVSVLGGDSDTVGAITGALAGAGTGPAAIPPRWLDALRDWPDPRRFSEDLAERLARMASDPTVEIRPVQGAPLRALLRNFAFLIVILAHGFRRLLPPY